MTEKERLLYAMARHIRNTDAIAPLDWGQRGYAMLNELRRLDPETYDRLVKLKKETACTDSLDS